MPTEEPDIDMQNLNLDTEKTCAQCHKSRDAEDMVFCCQEQIWLCQETCDALHHRMLAYRSGRHRGDSVPEGDYTGEESEEDMMDGTYNDEQIDLLQAMSSMNKTDRRRTISAYDTREIQEMYEIHTIMPSD